MCGLITTIISHDALTKIDELFQKIKDVNKFPTIWLPVVDLKHSSAALDLEKTYTQMPTMQNLLKEWCDLKMGDRISEIRGMITLKIYDYLPSPTDELLACIKTKLESAEYNLNSALINFILDTLKQHKSIKIKAMRYNDQDSIAEIISNIVNIINGSNRVSHLLELFMFLQQCGIDLAKNYKVLLAALYARLEEENKKFDTNLNLEFLQKLRPIIDEDCFEVFKFIYYTINKRRGRCIDDQTVVLGILRQQDTIAYEILVRNIELVIESLDLEKPNTQIDTNTIELILTAVNNRINMISYQRVKYLEFTIGRNPESGLYQYCTLNIENMELLRKEDRQDQAFFIGLLLNQSFLLLKYYSTRPDRDPAFKFETDEYNKMALFIGLLRFNRKLTPEMDAVLARIIPKGVFQRRVMITYENPEFHEHLYIKSTHSDPLWLMHEQYTYRR